MRYTVRCQGRVLGSTTLDFFHLVHGQHSGWLHAEPGADHLLDTTSIPSAAMRAWQMRGDTVDGRPLARPDFITSQECDAISVAVAARSHLVLTLHREDGSELPTREILVQDRIYFWDPPDDDGPYEGLDEQEDAEFEAPAEPEFAATRDWNEEEYEDEPASILNDDAFQRLVHAQWLEAAESRYQVHVRLANPDDLPSQLQWLRGSSE